MRKEALWTVANLTAGSPGHIEYVVSHGAIPALAQMLASDDFRLVIAALKGLDNILAAERKRTPDAEAWPWRDKLEECGGVRRLESLQSHASETVYRCVVSHLLQPRTARDLAA